MQDSLAWFSCILTDSWQVSVYIIIWWEENSLTFLSNVWNRPILFYIFRIDFLITQLAANMRQRNVFFQNTLLNTYAFGFEVEK